MRGRCTPESRAGIDCRAPGSGRTMSDARIGPNVWPGRHRGACPRKRTENPGPMLIGAATPLRFATPVNAPFACNHAPAHTTDDTASGQCATRPSIP